MWHKCEVPVSVGYHSPWRCKCGREYIFVKQKGYTFTRELVTGSFVHRILKRTPAYIQKQTMFYGRLLTWCRKVWLKDGKQQLRDVLAK